MLEYLNILAIGTALLIVMTRFGLFRTWWQSLTFNRLYSVCLLGIFCALFWPADPGASFAEGVAIDSTRIVRIITFCGIVLVLSFYMVKRRILPRKTIVYLYACYAAVCLSSILYSPYWQESLWKSFELIVLLLLALVTRKEMMTGRISYVQILQGFSFIMLATVVFSLVGIFLYPELASSFQQELGDMDTSSMGGIIPRVYSNTLGQFSSMIAFVGFFTAVIQRRAKAESILLIVLGSLGMVFAHARTSIVAFAGLLMIYGVFKGGIRGFLVMLSLACLSFLALDYVIQFTLRGQDTDMFLAMSGRTYMWAIALDAIFDEPWLGKGFHAGHKTLDINVGMEYSSLDNTYLESLVNVGIIGTVFLVAFVLVMLKRMIFLMRSCHSRSPEFWWINVSVGFVFVMFIRSLLGPSFQVLHINLVMFLIIAVMWEMYRDERRGVVLRNTGRLY